MQSIDYTNKSCNDGIGMDLEQKLKRYDELLHQWQAKINLVSNNTLNQSQERHFADSLQVLDYIPENTQRGIDLGSGAGFPGLVIAIANPDIHMTLVESDQKKCAFLKTVSRETQTKADVLNQRIEDVELDNAPDFITARALASLDKLFAYCEKWITANPDITLIFPKGQNYQSELERIETSWRYDLDIHPSRTDNEAVILVFSAISPL